MRKKYCPIIKDQCIGLKCSLWVSDVVKITDTKTLKTGVKDFSDCALHKIADTKDIVTMKLME